MWWHDGWDWALMVVGMAVVWAAIVALGVWFVRSTGMRDQRSDDADAILDRRLARGEIDPQEYQERRRALHGDGSGQTPISGH